MKVTRKPGRVRAASLRAIALFGLMSGSSYARDANDLLLKAVGTTEGVSPVICRGGQTRGDGPHA
jgi:hypothetical protein